MYSFFKLLKWARVPLLLVCLLMVSAVSVNYMADSKRPVPEAGALPQAGPDPQIAAVEEDLVPPHEDPASPAPPPPPPTPKPAAPKVVTAKPKAAKASTPAPLRPPTVVSAGASVYRGLGTWVDIFDTLNPREAVAEMSRRGVKTLYLQTSRYKQPEDIVDPPRINAFLDAAHEKGIAVVGWYVPGSNLERDLRGSLAVMNHRTPSGQGFDGFSPDIETAEFAADRPRFNAYVIEYSKALRERMPGQAIGATVVDAKNNERAPAKWAGFPWKEIAQYYDVVLPMAYWSVTKGAACGTEYDTAQYMRDVVRKTEALMGVSKPIHLIGGIANCMTGAEAVGFVNGAKDAGAIGGSLYDFDTIQKSGVKEIIWTETARFN